MPAGSFGSVLDVKVFNVSILVTTIAMLYWHVSPHFDVSFNKKLGKYFTCTPYTNENHLNTIVQVVYLAGATRLERATSRFGDECSAN